MAPPPPSTTPLPLAPPHQVPAPPPVFPLPPPPERHPAARAMPAGGAESLGKGRQQGAGRGGAGRGGRVGAGRGGQGAHQQWAATTSGARRRAARLNEPARERATGARCARTRGGGEGGHGWDEGGGRQSRLLPNQQGGEEWLVKGHAVNQVRIVLATAATALRHAFCSSGAQASAQGAGGRSLSPLPHPHLWLGWSVVVA